MPTLRQRFTKYRETRKRKARERKAAAEQQALEAARQAVAAEQLAIDAAAQTPLRKEFHRLLRETADRKNDKRPTLVIPPQALLALGSAEGKTKQTRRQKKTQAKRKKTEKKHRIKHKKTKKQRSPIRHYPPAKNTRLKKILITALASSPGITPFKGNPMQTGESGVKDIEYDTFKYYGVPKTAYKVGKDYSKRFDRETKKFLPRKVNHLPVIEEPLYREY